MVLSRFSVRLGKIADNKQMPTMKIKLGTMTPLLSVVLILTGFFIWNFNILGLLVIAFKK